MKPPGDRETVTQSQSVTPERFARVRAVFEAAVERPATERRAFVAGACVGDAAMQREVEAMLAADQLEGRPSSSAPEEGRFPAGTVLAGRFRILGRLGHGGMGEVYKAFDLILNQTVALKFLAPAHISEAALLRFRNEVRIARQVSHPNVCRAYDLGMVEDLHFLSMEYIDGEDLASLLRRIGRLPQDKAIEFTRKICGGLSAAHERGVLHRDLKPANIMIDGRGQVRITDFGLAALAAEIPLSDLRSGTPAYMSPEQKAGKEVTTRSDIYSLGLVLHEMFTGKARHETQSSPTELVKDLDPTIERLIVRCLEEDPKRRPSSALNVAMALPGAEPIAAALAAGETPSPEMVAASTEKEGFGRRTAILCFTAIIGSLVIGALLAPRTSLPIAAGLEIAPEALAFRAQEIVKQLGYTESPRRRAWGFSCCEGMPSGTSVALQALTTKRTPVAVFWYRQYKADLLPDSFVWLLVGSPALAFSSPANTEPGMLRLKLDPQGRLFQFEARPERFGTPSSAKEPDWNLLFSAAGLNPSLFQQAVPETVPLVPFETRRAWVGSYGEGNSEAVHIEAGAWQGRPVFFDVIAGPRVPTSSPESGTQPVILALLAIALATLCGAVVVARSNLRQGRGDRHGASFLATFAFLLVTVFWIFNSPHVAGVWEIALVVLGLSMSCFAGALVWLLFVAIEPYIRRHWPDSLISWSQLRAGRIMTPLVASHILAGITAADVFEWPGFGGVRALAAMAGSWRGGYESTAHQIAMVAGNLQTALLFSMAVVLFAVLMRFVVRRLWLADLFSAILLGTGGLGFLGSGVLRNALAVAFFSLAGCVWLWLFRRFGLISLFTAWATFGLSRYVSIALDGWYAGRSITFQLLPVAVAAWAVWVIFSKQSKPSEQSLA